MQNTDMQFHVCTYQILQLQAAEVDRGANKHTEPEKMKNGVQITSFL